MTPKPLHILQAESKLRHSRKPEVIVKVKVVRVKVEKPVKVVIRKTKVKVVKKTKVVYRKQPENLYKGRNILKPNPKANTGSVDWEKLKQHCNSQL